MRGGEGIFSAGQAPLMPYRGGFYATVLNRGSACGRAMALAQSLDVCSEGAMAAWETLAMSA